MMPNPDTVDAIAALICAQQTFGPGLPQPEIDSYWASRFNFIQDDYRDRAREVLLLLQGLPR